MVFCGSSSGKVNVVVILEILLFITYFKIGIPIVTTNIEVKITTIMIQSFSFCHSSYFHRWTDEFVKGPDFSKIWPRASTTITRRNTHTHIYIYIYTFFKKGD